MVQTGKHPDDRSGDGCQGCFVDEFLEALLERCQLPLPLDYSYLREPDIRDRRSQAEKRREDAQRRPAGDKRDDAKGRSEQVQPLDMDAIKREAEEHLKERRARSQERGQDHGEDLDI